MASSQDGYLEQIDVVKVERLSGGPHKPTRYRFHTKTRGNLLSKLGLRPSAKARKLTGRETGPAEVVIDPEGAVIAWRFL